MKHLKTCLIGTYCLAPYARSEQHIRQMKECGIDFVIGVNYDRSLLDLLEKYDMGAIVNGIVPGWFGGLGENAGTLEQTHPLTQYQLGSQNYIDHPAIWGIDVGDEPSALDFPYYGQVVRSVSDLFLQQFPYLNLYPNYAMLGQNTPEEVRNQLGTETYSEYIDSYCRNVPTKYISFDFYPYSRNIPDFFRTLYTVSKACHVHSRQMWAVLQVNSSDPKIWISENMLRFQAFSALAFGTVSISWACYTAGWWHNQVLDNQGNKTQQYEKLRRINQEIYNLTHDRFHGPNDSTYWVGNPSEYIPPENASQLLASFSNLYITDLCAESGELLLLRETDTWSPNHTELFILAASDPYDKNPHSLTLRLHANGVTPYCIRSSGNRESIQKDNDTYWLTIHTNEAIYLLADEA